MADCENCYFWHKEVYICCLKGRYRVTEGECEDAIFDLVWDEKQGKAVPKEVPT